MSESIITIAELDAVTTAPDSSFIPIDNGTTTNKITVENFNASSTATATAQALKSEGYAVGKQDGADVDSSSPYYQNNAKYYKEQAAQSATSAADSYTGVLLNVAAAANSASEAETSAGTAQGYATQAGNSKDAAALSAAAAASAETSALGYKNTASSAASSASASAADALGYKDAALGYKNDAATSESAAEGYMNRAEAAAASAEAITTTPPYIGANGNWYVWDVEEDDYVDSGVAAQGDKGDPGYSPAVSISTITGGHSVTITDEDHPSGQSFNVMDGVHGTDGVSPEVTITPITGGTQVTITDEDHPSGQSFNVMNGTGAGDMTAAVYDSDSAVATAGGIADFVEDKIEEFTDYVTPQMYGAYGDGVHDDTAAVNAALNSGNPRVYFPAGEYLVQWLNSITLTDRALFISGAGKYESIIHFADARESSGDGYGYRFTTGTSGTSSIFIRDIGLYHDNQDPEVTYTAVNYNLLAFNGQFKAIDVDNVYIHSGYNRSTNCATPYNTCIWGKAGADEIRVTNTVFENYDNRIKGGGLWWSPSDWSRKFTCGHVEFSGNTFRHTNNDEAIAFWALGDDEDETVFRDNEFNMREVKMVNNTIIHDNFNGECYQTDYLINFAARKWNKNLKANYFFSGNKIILEKSKLGVLRSENLDEVVISDNDIYVGSIIAQDNANTWHVVAPISGRVVFKHNMFNCQAPTNTDRVNIATYKSTLEVIQNVFRSSFWLVLRSWNPGSDYENPDKDNQGTCINFVGNILENKSIGVEATNNTRFNIIDNSINGTINFQGTQTSGSYITLKGNRFRYRYGDVTEANLKGYDVKLVENTGLKLIVSSADISTAMAYFEYVGRKEDLVFKVNNVIVPDSPTVRARFFTSCDISYIEDTTAKADKVASATAGNFAGLDANGNLTDSGKSASDFSLVTTDHNGTASSSAVRSQRISIDGTYYDIDGSIYMEQTVTLDTAQEVTARFTNAAITATSAIDVFTSAFGVEITNLVISAGSVDVTFGTVDSATTITCRIYIK